MNVKFGKITIEFQYSKYNDIIEYRIDSKLAKRYYQENELFPYIEDEEDIQDVLTGYIFNTDTYICILKWLIDNKIKTTIKAVGDSIFWTIHDYYHAINDVTGIEIYVNGNIETERIIQTLKYTTKHKIEIDNSFLENLEDLMWRRFNKRINLEQYKQYEFN